MREHVELANQVYAIVEETGVPFSSHIVAAIEQYISAMRK
jgi:hypothetical protein